MNRKCIAAFLLLSVTLLMAPLPVSSQRRIESGVLPGGSNIVVRLTESLDSDVNTTGDQFQAILDQDLLDNGRVLATAGSPVTGRLVDVRKSGRVSGRARMLLTLSEIRIGGVTYQLETNTITVEAGSGAKKDATIIGGGTALGALIGALAGGGKGAAIGAATGAGAGTGFVLLTPGKDVKFEPEQRFNFVLQRSVRFDGRGRSDSSYPYRYGASPRYESRSIDQSRREDVAIIARDLDAAAQQMWNMVRNRRSEFGGYQGDEGSELYTAIGDFSHSASAYADQANDFRRENLRASARRLIQNAEHISTLLDRTDSTFQIRDDWRRVEDQVSRLADAFNIRYAIAGGFSRAHYPYGH